MHRQYPLFQQPIRTSHLYNDNDLIRALHEGIEELVTHCANEKDERQFRVNHFTSNCVIVFGITAAVFGLKAFFQPFGASSRRVTAYWIALYFVFYLLLNFVEWIVNEHISVVFAPRSKKPNTQLVIGCAFNVERKTVTMALGTGYSSPGACLYGISKLRHFLNIKALLKLYFGSAIAAWFQTKFIYSEADSASVVNSLRLECSPCTMLQMMELALVKDFREAREIAQKRNLLAQESAKNKQKKTQDNKRNRNCRSVHTLERSITAYFDTQGYLCHQALLNDLESLLKEVV